MIVAKTSIGSNDVLIEAVDDVIQIAGGVVGRQTEVTGIEDTLRDAYGRVKSLIATMSGDIAESVKDKISSGQKLEVEFSLGLSATSGFWIISGRGEGGIKVKMTWGKE